MKKKYALWLVWASYLLLSSVAMQAASKSGWERSSYATNLNMLPYYEFEKVTFFATYTEEYEVATCSAITASNTYGPMYSTTNTNAVSRTAAIYPASLLVGVAGQELESIHFERIGATADPTGGTMNFKVYLKEVSDIDFGTGAWTWDTTGATLVYDSNPLTAMSGGLGWKNFVFSTKFTYSGMQNLMVLMEYVNTGNTTNIQWKYEYNSPCVDTSNNNTTKYNNNTTGALNSSLASTNYRRPSIKLSYSVACASPQDLTVSAITANSATVSWSKGGTETAWEYAVQPVGQGIPTSYTPATSTSINLTGLSPATGYEVYVRSDCGSTDGKSVWKMEAFGTSCGVITSSLWWEGFNSNSASIDCWTIVDGNNDSTSATANIWHMNTVNYEGTHSARFYGTSATALPHDDWLISPAYKMQAGKKYRLKYHYRTNSTTSYDYEFAVLMSTTGSDSTSKFTTTIVPKKKYTPSTTWFEEYLIIDGVNADVNIAWHVTSSTQYTYVYLDNIFIEEVEGCPEPMNLDVKGVGADKATLYWTDNFGATDWEYYVQEAGGTKPVSGGTSTTAKEVTVTQDASGKALEDNTEYEYYVRTSCGGGEYSIWQGPFAFQTQCKAFIPPFWEGFNTDSKTLNCWTILANPNGGAPTTTSNIWHTYGTGTTSYTEGDQGMRFYSLSTYAPHDDWLISPALKLDSTKIYKLTYDYKTSASYSNEFRVLLSKGGVSKSDFTTTLLSKIDSSNDWETESLFIGGIDGDVNIAWHVTTPASTTYLYVDNVNLVEVSCADPMNLDVKDIEGSRATILWEDSFNSSWEYVVQEEGEGYPSGSGTSVSTKEVNVVKDNSGANLKPNVEYEFYVRAKCSDGTFGDWIGPFVFKTECSAVSLPFTETFETNSTTIDCWTVIDVGGDGSGTTTMTNTWGLYTLASYAYEGSNSMRFYGTSAGAPFDDWLVSPTIQMKNTDTYQLTYHYRTNASYENNFEVKLSTNGTDPSQFTTTLLASDTYKNGGYEKKTLYITGVDGDVNIGWHITSSNSSYSYVYLDLITIEKVDCIGPDDGIEVSNIDTDSADFEWKDTHNTQWEYYVQDAGGVPPVGSGTLANSNKVTVTRTSGTGGVNLQPNTEYEFYVRSTCGPGKSSQWIGPVIFRTLCTVAPFPFWEGFNSDSETLDCWTIVDGNNDSTSATANIWHMNTVNYEGTHSARFYGTSATALPHDDWLISPTFRLDPNKIYRLKYHYRTTSTTSYDYEFGVFLSNNGIDTKEFTTEVVSKRKYDPSTTWFEQKAFITGVGGDIHLAWHVTSETQYTYVYIDNIYFEEVTCVEPVDLGSKDEKENSAVVFWKDDVGSDWEYIVQKSGSGTPLPATTGTATTNKEVAVTTDKNGDALEHNTEYELYVRTKCADGSFGEWSGPYEFKTACDVFSTPFWEGFNSNSNTLDCWTIIDGNDDSTATTSNIWHMNTTSYEGNQSARFYGTSSTNLPHNDWLISPKIRFEPGKTYRLKYHYRTTSTTSYDYEFEVLLSNSGVDTSKFTTSVVSKKKYDPSTVWQEEYVFISGVSGDVNIAWHVTSSTQYTYVYVDNVFIEEVQGCPEPLPATFGVKDEKSDSVTLLWDDDFGATAWEYYIQEEGGVVPVGSGIATTNKENIATLDGAGNALKPNTDYEFYVRTNCGNGEYSIWQGPYQFTTACGVYTTPFWDGFNTADKIYRCWTVIDGNGDSTSPTGSNIWRLYDTASGIYEGDQSMYFYGLSGKTHDDWLISPTIEMDPALYVLKYRYKTSATTSYNSSFEILLSSQGVDTTKFTTTVLPTDIYKEGNWKEGVVFFNGVSGDVNLAWHVNSTGTTYVYLDDIDLKKVETCPEPYYVTVTNQTSTSIELEWEQYGGVTSWEVIVVNYGEDETATPVQTVTVSGTPKATITGLSGGKAYTVYVRAKCEDGKSSSDWSTPIDAGTKVGANDECAGAVNVPVNKGMDCEQMVPVSMMGATESALAQPSCSTSKKSDIWFEFTATNEDHTIKLEDWKNLDGGSVTTLYGAIYDQSCSSMTDAALCFTVTPTSNSILIRGFTIGHKYYIRLGTTSTTEVRDIFNMCITSPRYLEVSPSGEKYTPEELIKDVLVKSDCDLVSNVNYKIGDGSPATKSINTLGYFNGNGSIFPFEEGIVLSTGEIEYVSGPCRGGGTAPGGSTNARGNNPHRWNGDKDLNDAIADAGGTTVGGGSMRSTEIEFDFIPVKDSIHFEYLFASNSYDRSCTTAGCNNGAMFAAWLIDLTTGEGVNLAKVPETDTPIALNTVRNATQSGKPCTDENVEYYWKHYTEGGVGMNDPMEAAVDYAGLTTAMQSQKVYVVPGRKYHIKLAVMDFCSTNAHTSAVFFNAGSFDLGNLDLGADLLVETDNALCGEECVTIKSGLGADEDTDVDVDIQWYKDGELIPGATGANYEACESGTYRVVGKYTAINCEVEGEKVIEIYPPISEVVSNPKAFEVCRYSLFDRKLDLSSVEEEMFTRVDREDYETSYYLTEEEAVQGSENTIGTDYLVEGVESHRVYIRVEDLRTGCTEVFALPIQVQKGEVPTKPSNVSVCAEYVFPGLEENQYYYTESAAGGVEYKAGDVLDVPGEHTIYVLQLNGEGSCYEEVSFVVDVTAPVVADVFEDVSLSCELYELQPLSEYNKYFTEPNGGGIELYAGMEIPLAQTIYVYAKSDDGLCEDESSFTVTYEDCPIPRGISPNGDGLNDTFDLSRHGVESIKIYNRWGTEVYSYGLGYTDQWYGQSKNGKELPDGTYYYVIIAHGKTRTGWVQINR